MLPTVTKQWIACYHVSGCGKPKVNWIREENTPNRPDWAYRFTTYDAALTHATEIAMRVRSILGIGVVTEEIRPVVANFNNVRIVR